MGVPRQHDFVPCAPNWSSDHREYMSASWFPLILVGTWAVFGPSMGLLMRRLGHSGPMWTLIGLVFGPFSIVLAFQAVGEEPKGLARVTHRGRPGDGPVDVVVGIDGSVESHAAMRLVVELLGPQLGELTLATVLDFDSGQAGGSPSIRRAAEQVLKEASEQLAEATNFEPTLVVLIGRPSVALQRHATDQGFNLIAVGSRGVGKARTVLGSVATDLAQATTTPALIASRYSPNKRL